MEIKDHVLTVKKNGIPEIVSMERMRTEIYTELIDLLAESISTMTAMQLKDTWKGWFEHLTDMYIRTKYQKNQKNIKLNINDLKFYLVSALFDAYVRRR